MHTGTRVPDRRGAARTAPVMRLTAASLLKAQSGKALYPPPRDAPSRALLLPMGGLSLDGSP